MICVDCGKESEGLIQGSCAACFADRTPLMHVPEMVHLELCANCQARHVGAHWHDVEPDTPEEWLREEAVQEACGVHHEVDEVQLTVAERQLDERTFAFEVEMTGQVQDVPVTAQASCQLRRIRGVCDRCSRIAGGYYAAIIQLRATERDVTAPELERAHELIAAELTDTQKDKLAEAMHQMMGMEIAARRTTTLANVVELSMNLGGNLACPGSNQLSLSGGTAPPEVRVGSAFCEGFSIDAALL